MLFLTMQKICVIVPLYETVRVFCWNTMSERCLIGWHLADILLWISLKFHSQKKIRSLQCRTLIFTLESSFILLVRELNSSPKLIIAMSHFLQKHQVELNSKM